MKFRLNPNSYSRFRSLRAPEEMLMPAFGGTGESTPGGSGGGAPFENGSGQQGALIGQEGEDEEESLDDLFKAFEPPAPDPNNPPPNDEPQLELSPERIQNVQTSVQNAIKNMRVPEDMIPADFDPQDRGQMASMMTRMMQATIAQSLNVVFQPVQLAMEQMQSTLRGEMRNEINESRTGIQESAVFEQEVPEVNNPKYSAMIKGMDAQLKSAGKKVGERAKTIRRFLNQMNINEPATPSNTRRTANPNGSGGNPSRREGMAALDSFFGSFKPPK